MLPPNFLISSTLPFSFLKMGPPLFSEFFVYIPLIFSNLRFYISRFFYDFFLLTFYDATLIISM